MRADIKFIKAKFNEFNSLIFKNNLPEIPIQLSTGCRTLGGLHVTCECANPKNRTYKFIFSTRFDLPQRLLEDIIIHEMIHLLIAFKGIRDTGPHGQVFKQTMNTINQRFGRNITVTSKLPDAVKETDNTFTCYYLITFHVKDKNLDGIMRCAKTFIFNALRQFEDNPNISDIKIYVSTESFFNRLQNSRTLRYHILTDPIRSALSSAKPLIKVGNTIRPKR
ncbi:MAG: SprT-like domain-containing protein [Prevotella sp.]|nr:SprT-like domain-containing protein [Prevotella sp.]MCM1075300.1 SprT-like domain-containing protein [Ruminococcus sp.]